MAAAVRPSEAVHRGGAAGRLDYSSPGRIENGALNRGALTVPEVRVSFSALHSRSQEVDHAADCTKRFLRPLRSQRLASRPFTGRVTRPLAGGA